MDTGSLAEAWLAFKRDEVGASTLYTYERILTNRVLPALADVRLASITTLDLQRILMDALSERSPNEGLKTRAVLRGMFGYAHHLGLVSTDPAASIRLPKGTSTYRVGIRSVPSPANARSVSLALGPRYGLMPLLAAFAGLRWQEVAALQASDLDFDRRVITVVRALGRMEGVKEPKSVAGRRKTVWASEITADIEEHLDHFDGDWLFTTARGALLHYSNWRRRHWLPACEESGMEWTFHEYRHTFAVESLRRGRSIQSVAAMMGHANPRVTWEFYAGLFEDHLDQARASW